MEGCLLGKFLHPRGVSREGFRSALQQVWRTADEVKIKKLGSKIFMFKFASEVDKKRVLSGGPWHFRTSFDSSKRAEWSWGNNETIIYSCCILGTTPYCPCWVHGSGNNTSVGEGDWYS